MSKILPKSRRPAWPMLLALVALGSLVLAGCADVPGSGAPSAADPAAAAEPDEALDQATLSLVASDETPTEVAVDLIYTKGASQVGPRMMELFVQPTGDLAYLRAEPLSAAASAGKDVIVQKEPDGTLRALLFTTTNTTRLASGPLMRLWFSRAGGGTVALVDQRPIFAPPDADQGVVLGQPLTVGGSR